MISSNELRLGNLVILQNKEYRPNESGFIHKVTGINEKFGKHADELGNFVFELQRQENNVFEDRYGQYICVICTIPFIFKILIIACSSLSITIFFIAFFHNLKY